LQILRKVLRRTADRLHPKLSKALLRVLGREDLRYFRIELVDNRLGRAGWRDDAVPRAADYVAVAIPRSSLIPDVPTTAEDGYSDVVGSAWNGVVAPAGTPRAIVDKLNSEISQVLATQDTKQRFSELGMQSVGGTPQDFAQYLQAESEKWAAVISAAHLQAPQ
jgi:hypothetical protein